MKTYRGIERDDDYEDRNSDDIEDDLLGMIEDEYNERHRNEPAGENNFGCSWCLITIIGLATICVQVLSALEF